MSKISITPLQGESLSLGTSDRGTGSNRSIRYNLREQDWDMVSVPWVVSAC